MANMTALVNFLSSVWPFIATIVAANLTGWWALRLASHKYDQEGGKDEQIAKLINSYIEAAQKAAAYATEVQEEMSAQKKEFEITQKEMEGLRCEITLLKVQLKENKEKSEIQDNEIAYLKDRLSKYDTSYATRGKTKPKPKGE
jgi:chromosome segregation ATPase